MASATMPFRFLDLPPELRNSVYELTLRHDRSQPDLIATPALLRSCNQVYKEAKGILYAESTFTLTAKIHMTQVRPDFTSLEQNQLSLEGDVQPHSETFSSAVKIYAALPPAMLHTSQIHIHLDLSTKHYQTKSLTICFIYALVEYLNSDGRHHQVELCITRKDISSFHLSKLLWAFENLHPRVGVVLTSTTDPECGTAIKERLAKRSESTFTHIADFIHLNKARPCIKDVAWGSAYGLAYFLLWQIEGGLAPPRGFGKSNDHVLGIQLVAATRLLANTNEPLDTLEEPPQWLLMCFEAALQTYPKNEDNDEMSTLARIENDFDDFFPQVGRGIIKDMVMRHMLSGTAIAASS